MIRQKTLSFSRDKMNALWKCFFFPFHSYIMHTNCNLSHTCWVKSNIFMKNNVFFILSNTQLLRDRKKFHPSSGQMKQRLMFIAGLKPELEKDSLQGIFVFPFLTTRLLCKAHMQHWPSAKIVFFKNTSPLIKQRISIIPFCNDFISLCIRVKGNTLSCTALPSFLKHQH